MVHKNKQNITACFYVFSVYLVYLVSVVFQAELFEISLLVM